MVERLRAAILHLDPRTGAADLADQVAAVSAALPDDAAVTTVGPVRLAAHRHVPVDVEIGNARRPAGPLAPLVRMLTGNLRARRAWRSLRANAAAIEELRTADLVVVVDPLAHRAGWVLARKYGVHAVTGLRTVRYATSQLSRPTASR